MKNMNQTLISFSFLLLILFHSTTALSLRPAGPAQAPSHEKPAETPAQAPTKPTPAVHHVPPVQAPAAQVATPVQAPSEEPLVQAPPSRAKAEPTNITKILEKASSFSVFVRILRSTQIIEQLENQLNTSNSLTIFAPTNGAFSALKPGTLNSLNAEQKVQLVQYHILPSFVSLSNFQTLSNPVRTQASNTDEYPLNITTQGDWVNLSTGLVNTSISGTVYADNQLAIYKVDKVLLPPRIFSSKTKAPAPAPALANPDKGSSGSSSSSSSSSGSSTLDTPAGATEASNALRLAGNGMATIGFFGVGTILILWGQFKFSLW